MSGVEGGKEGDNIKFLPIPINHCIKHDADAIVRTKKLIFVLSN